MEESLEEFIKLSRNIKQEEPSKINKEAQVTAQVKKECDMRAMKIVELSIEGKLLPEVFLRCLPFINQSHYQDIVEERAISKLCGYCLCGRRIQDMPKKQYLISTKSNKVYDITERKNYCSNFCYKASLHVKKQVDTSPLWLRQYDKFPQFKLLDPADRGLPGEEIQYNIAKPNLEPNFTSVSLFTQASLDDMIEREIDLKSGKSKMHRKSSLKANLQTINENVQSEEDEEKLIEDKGKKKKKLDRNMKIKTLPSIDESEEKVEKQLETEDQSKIDEVIALPESPVLESEKENQIKSASCNIASNKDKIEKSNKKRKSKAKIDIEGLIKKSFNEWLTLDTYLFIYGEKIEEILSEKKLSDCFDSLRIGELRRDQQIKYMNICRKLHLQEMADEKFDNSLMGNNRKLLPVPDFSSLKEENKDIQVKVKAFYSGIPYEQEDKNFPVKKVEENNNPDENIPVVLPLVDVNSQNAMRRKIFLNSINKAVEQLLQTLQIQSYTTVLSDLQALVKTFKLSADNIVFKPIVWTYISVVLLYLLALRTKSLQDFLDEPQSQQLLDLTVGMLPNKMNFIKDLIKHFQNVDLFIENYITEKSCD